VQADINRGLQAELARLREEKAIAESLGLCRGAEAADAAARAARLEADLRAAEARVRELEAVRRALHNTIQARGPVVRTLCAYLHSNTLGAELLAFACCIVSRSVESGTCMSATLKCKLLWLDIFLAKSRLLPQRLSRQPLDAP